MRDLTGFLCTISFAVAVGCGGSTSGDSTGSGGAGSGGKGSGGSSTGATGGATTGGSSGTGNVSGGGSGGAGGSCLGTPCGPDGAQCCDPGTSCGSSGSNEVCSCTQAFVWACGSSAGGNGGAGGCVDVGCGPHGASCCQPGSGCGTASGGGPSISCNCTNSLTWDCGAGGGGTGGVGGAPCNGPGGCAVGTNCCAGKCVNLQNDPLNCGACANVCAASPPYCSGQCGIPPCFAPTPPPPGSFCCGQAHCKQGQLCCEVQGPGPTGGPICHTPTAAQPTCPIGCPLCQ